jgi:hypothetical protein
VKTNPEKSTPSGIEEKEGSGTPTEGSESPEKNLVAELDRLFDLEVKRRGVSDGAPAAINKPTCLPCGHPCFSFCHSMCNEQREPKPK